MLTSRLIVVIMDPTEENRGRLYTDHFADHGSHTEENRDRLYINILADHGYYRGE
jgi:hypothetical protein